MNHLDDDTLRRFVEGEMGDHLAEHVALHLDECPRCAGRLVALDPLAPLLARTPAISTPPGLVDTILVAASAPAPADRSVRAVWVGCALLGASALLGGALTLRAPETLTALQTFITMSKAAVALSADLDLLRLAGLTAALSLLAASAMARGGLARPRALG